MSHVTEEYWECDHCGKRVDDRDDIRDWLNEHYTGSLLCMLCGGQLKAKVSDFCSRPVEPVQSASEEKK